MSLSQMGPTNYSGDDVSTGQTGPALNASGSGWNGYGPGGGTFAQGSYQGFQANPDINANEINQDNAAAASYYGQAGNGIAINSIMPIGSYGVGTTGDAASQASLASTYGQQNALAAQLRGTIANPGSSLAAQQFSANAAQGQQATTALGNSTAGGLAAAGARRGAQQANAVQNAANQSGLQQTEAGAVQSAQGQLSSLYGSMGQLSNGQTSLENGVAQKNAQLQQGYNQVNNAANLGLYGLSANEQGMATGAATQYSNDLLGEAGASNEEQQTQNAFGNAVTGAAMSAAGAGISAFQGAAGTYGGSDDDSQQNKEQQENQY